MNEWTSERMSDWMNGWLNDWRNKKYELMSTWDIENTWVNECTVKQLNDRVHE